MDQAAKDSLLSQGDNDTIWATFPTSLPPTYRHIRVEELEEYIQSLIYEDESLYEGAQGNKLLETSVDFDWDFTKDLADTPKMASGRTQIANGAYAHCKDLKVANMPNTVKVIGDQAFYFSGIEKLKLSKNLVHVGEDAFNGCYHLDTVTIPSLYNYCKIHFEDCSPLAYAKNVVIDGKPFDGIITIDCGVYTIKPGVFRDFSLLENLYIGDGTKIGAEAFRDCHNLKQVTIAEGVEEIGDRAFFNTQNLKNIFIPDSVVGFGTKIFDSWKPVDITIECHAGSYAEAFAKENGYKVKIV
jgi:hypothetical protein